MASRNGGGIGIFGLLAIGAVGFLGWQMLTSNGGGGNGNGFIPTGDNVFPDITDEDLFGELAYG